MKIRFPLLALLAFSLLILAGCENKPLYRRSFLSMGTTAELTVIAEINDRLEMAKACDAAELRVGRIEALVSIFDKSSAVSRINNNEKKTIVMAGGELFRVVKTAREYSKLTGGAFDFTIEPLTELWGFGRARQVEPGAQTIKDSLKHTGFDKIELDERRRVLIFKDPLMRLDFGGIAPGYAADEIARIFNRFSIRNALINMGGEIYCMGFGPGGKDWVIGIQDPENKGKILARLKLHDKAVATSGNYENFKVYNGKRHAHIIDPRTGLTVSNNLTSVTTIASSCAEADALSTAVFVLGEEKGLELVERLSGVECLLVVTRDGRQEMVMSRGIGKYLEK